MTSHQPTDQGGSFEFIPRASVIDNGTEGEAVAVEEFAEDLSGHCPSGNSPTIFVYDSARLFAAGLRGVRNRNTVNTVVICPCNGSPTHSL